MRSCFYGYVTTRYDGMEWGQHFVVEAENVEDAQKKAEREEWTHDDEIEEVLNVSVRQIPEGHYTVLSQYIAIIG